MIDIEFVQTTGNYGPGDRLRVDENSADSLVKRGAAKVIEVVDPEVVESGGARARAATDAKKAADAEKEAAAAAEASAAAEAEKEAAIAAAKAGELGKGSK